MAPKSKPQTKAEIPAELQCLYVERDGAWCLDVDGAVDRAKLEDLSPAAARSFRAWSRPLSPEVRPPGVL